MNTPLDSAAASATNVSKIYGHDDSEVRALDDVTIQFEKGHFTVVVTVNLAHVYRASSCWI